MTPGPRTARAVLRALLASRIGRCRMAVCLRRAAPLAFVVSALLATGAAAVQVAPETLATAEKRPGETNPISNPNNLTLFRVQTLGLLASQNNVTNSDLLDFKPADAALTRWTQSGQELDTGDPCTATPRRRLAHGRITTPDFEQPVCVTPFGVSLYTTSLEIPVARYVSYRFQRPGGGSEARDFDAAVGELSMRPGVDEKLHQEIVVARANLDGHLEVDVLAWRPAGPAATSAEGTLAKAGSYIGPDAERISGDVAATLGDFDNDGRLDILVAADVSTGTVGPGKILLVAFSYREGAGGLARKASYTLETPAPPRSVVLAAGDFGSVGFDQAILGYFPTSGEGSAAGIHLLYFVIGKDLAIAAPKLTQTLAVPAPRSFFEIAPGLFWFDPGEGGTEPDFAFHTRQLAVAYTDADGAVLGQVVAVKPTQDGFTLGQPVVLSVDGKPAAVDDIGPALAVGNLIGLKSTKVEPLDQLSVTVPVKVGLSLQPQVVVSTVSGRTFQIAPVWRNEMPIYQTTGTVLSVPTIAYDRGGDSFYLGNPAHIQVPALIDPQYVVEMPPRHVDCLPSAGGDDGGGCQIVNVNGSNYSQFNVRLEDAEEETLTQTSTDMSSSQFGVDTSQTVGSTVQDGIMEIATVEVSTQTKIAFGYESNSVQRRIDRSYESISTRRSATTTEDDQVIFNMRTLDVWRYPVYGLDLERSKTFPFYDIVIPGPLQQYSAGGLSVEWYGPRHANYNALSYTAIDSPDFPDDLGTFSFKKGGGEETRKEPLNRSVVRSFDGNDQTFDLAYTEQAGSSTEKSFQYTLSNSTDVTVGFRANATIELFSGGVNYEGTVSLSNRSSWENSTLSERQITNSRGITLTQPDAPGSAQYAYNYKTLVYVTRNGGFKVAHAVDPLGSQVGRAWWLANYGGRPDPALNLPNRVQYDPVQFVFQLTPGPSYFWLRGIALTAAKPNPDTGQYTYLTGGVDAGTPVRVETRVYNFSLDAPAEKVVVAFAYQALDPNKFQPVGEPTEFARTQPMTIPPRGVVTVDAVLDTAKLGGTGAGTPYRFVITIDPDDAIENEIAETSQEDGGNNRGTWPWSSGFYVYNTGDADRRTGLFPGGSAPLLDVALRPLPGASGAAWSHEVTATITTAAADPALRHLVVAREGSDGIGEVLAARTLFGLGRGEHRVVLPVRLRAGEGGRLYAWLSSSGRRSEPLTGQRTPVRAQGQVAVRGD